MSTETTTKEYSQIRSLKDVKFDVDHLHEYSLSLSVGIRDFQICVTDAEDRVIFLEDIRLENVKTVNTRIKVLSQVFDEHHFLKAGFWKNIRLVLKTHKFTLVPTSHFVPDAQADYLAVSCELRPTVEEIRCYHHNGSGAVNIFAADKRLIQWVGSIYKKKKIEVLHQGSALINGIMAQEGLPTTKTMFCLFDRGIVHVVVAQQKKLAYYNQFAARKSEDILKYIMLVFKELELNQKTTPVVVWGSIKENSPNLDFLRKYIRKISMGPRPSKLKFGVQLNNMASHRYFDLFSIHLS